MHLKRHRMQYNAHKHTHKIHIQRTTCTKTHNIRIYTYNTHNIPITHMFKYTHPITESTQEIQIKYISNAYKYMEYT